MGHFNISITGVGGHGCERNAKAGQKLYARCGRFACPDCAAYDFTQRLRQAGMLREDEQAYSAPLAKDVVERMKEKGLLVALERGSDPTRQTQYLHVEVTDLEFVPDGATKVVAYKNDGSNIIDAYASYPMKAEFTHWPDTPSAVVDDMLRNERKLGSF